MKRLELLVNEGFLCLHEEAREHLTSQRYLQQLNSALVAFRVKQGQPVMLIEVVSVTTKMESYLLPLPDTLTCTSCICARMSVK